MKYDVLESKIGYVFNDKSLINLAVMHSSYGNDHKLEDYITMSDLNF